MVNAAVTTVRDAERSLAIGYAPADRRAALAALLMLDTRLGEVIAAARAPLAGQLRLAWWRDTLVALDEGLAGAEPVLAVLRAEVLPLGLRGADLAALTDGWEHLFAEPPDLAGVASERGGALFAMAARVLDDRHRDVAAAGEGWALVDLARHLGDPDLAASARDLASERLARAFDAGWPPALRPLGALALSARADLAGVPPGSPRRIARLAWHRLTGR